jgi:hypothetical protein
MDYKYDIYLDSFSYFKCLKISMVAIKAEFLAYILGHAI